MRIAAHVGVKDEIELIGPCIDHLLRIGVGEIIVCDMKSSDGTAEYLETRRPHVSEIVSVANADSNESWIAANMAAIRRSEAEWIMFLDADEFHLPASGRIADCLVAGADVISVPRYNVPVAAAGPLLPKDLSPGNYGDAYMIAKPVPQFRKRLQDDPELPWIRAIPLPKVIARRSLIAELASGGHDIVGVEGHGLARADSKQAVIAHLPFTTLERFAAKVANYREVIRYHADSVGPGFAWHWRRWIDLADRGLLEDEYRRSVFDAAAIAELKASGVILTAAELLQP